MMVHKNMNAFVSIFEMSIRMGELCSTYFGCHKTIFLGF